MKQHDFLFLGFLVFLLFVSPSYAQTITGQIRLGSSITSFSGQSQSTISPRAGLTAGVSLGYDFYNGLIIQADILYTTKGAYLEGEIDVDDDGIPDVPIRARSDLTYLDVPLLLVYRFQNKGTVHPRFFVGPSVNLKLNSKIRFGPPGGELSQTEDDDSIKRLDYGGVAGAGLDIEVGSQIVTVEVRGILGLSTINKPQEAVGPNPTSSEFKNTGVVILLGIAF